VFVEHSVTGTKPGKQARTPLELNELEQATPPLLAGTWLMARFGSGLMTQSWRLQHELSTPAGIILSETEMKRVVMQVLSGLQSCTLAISSMIHLLLPG
jgi:hypothetical protein